MLSIFTEKINIRNVEGFRVDSRDKCLNWWSNGTCLIVFIMPFLSDIRLHAYNRDFASWIVPVSQQVVDLAIFAYSYIHEVYLWYRLGDRVWDFVCTIIQLQNDIKMRTISRRHVKLFHVLQKKLHFAHFEVRNLPVLRKQWESLPLLCACCLWFTVPRSR